MFALAEALHAHGHVREAGRLARELAEEMISSGPDAGIDYSAAKGNLLSFVLLDRPLELTRLW